MATEIVSSFDDLARVFAESGLIHESDPAANVVRLPTRKGELEGVLFLHWQDDFKVLHVVQTLNFLVPDDRIQATALAVTILNHALPFPGFGINLGEKRAYFRLTMPLRPEGTITKDEVQGLFNLAVGTASEHVGVLRKVAEEGADPLEALAAAIPPAG